MSSSYMCFYYTNVRTNRRYEFCIIAILVGKIVERYFYFMGMIFLRDDISQQNVVVYLKIIPLEQNACFFCIQTTIGFSQMDQTTSYLT